MSITKDRATVRHSTPSTIGHRPITSAIAGVLRNRVEAAAPAAAAAAAARRGPSTDAIIAAIAVGSAASVASIMRSEEHTSELQSRGHLACRLLLEKKK